MTARSWIPDGPEVALRTDQLRARGVSRSRLEAADVERAFHGVILLPGTNYDFSSALERCVAFGPLMRPGWFFTRRSAAAIWGIPAPQIPDGQVEIGSVRPLRAPRRPTVRGHHVPDGVLQMHRRYDLPVPSPADVWCLLAPVIQYRELVAVGDYLLSGPVQKPRVPIATRDELTDAVRRHAGTAGAPARRRALEMLRSPVDSRPETYLRLATIAAGLPEPVVSCPVRVRGPRGPIELHADNGYPKWKIAGEYEGGVHFQDPLRAKRDVERFERMSDAGWRVVRATSLDLPNFEDYVGRLGRCITERRSNG